MKTCAKADAYYVAFGRDHLRSIFIALAALFLGEALTWKVTIGALLMIAGAIIISV